MMNEKKGKGTRTRLGKNLGKLMIFTLARSAIDRGGVFLLHKCCPIDLKDGAFNRKNFLHFISWNFDFPEFASLFSLKEILISGSLEAQKETKLK